MKKKEKNNDNNKTIIAIVAVALLIALVGGGTYAYWSWRSNNNTAVSFTVSGGTMTIDGGGNITAKNLAPAACTNTNYAIQRKVKVTMSNETTTPMVGTIKLNVVGLTASHGTLSSTHTQSLNYALVSVTSSEYSASTWKGCATNVATGTFSSYSTGSAITLLNNLSVPALSGTTAGTATYYYELYIWISPSYTGATSSGTTITDPMQDLTLNLAWAGSMTNQV